MGILQDISSKRIYIDGGFGSLCIERGIKFSETNLLSLTNKEAVIQIHKDYINAGANVITTNTFGATSLKFENYEQIIKESINCAKIAKGDRNDVYIAFDVGPTGKMLKPYGDLDFLDAVEIFRKSVQVAVNCGVDLIIIETFNDLYETKAAVLAVKEVTTLPIFVTNVYDASGKLLTGADAKTMIAMLESLGVNAVGMNCSFGPDVMLNNISEFIKYSSLPIIVSPNAGLPSLVNGKTKYSINSTNFAKYMVKIAKKGVSILGGCCGTTPKYIEKLVEKTKNIPLKPIKEKNYTIVTSQNKSVIIDKKPILIGERINPTGKPLLKNAILNGDYSYILNEGVLQEEKGVDILDVNVGVPGINESEVLEKTIIELQQVIDLPLQIDTSNVLALEKAMKIYMGKPLVNSVNGKVESMNAVFPLIKKYGGSVIALTLDENGIPNTAKERIEIAKKIISTAKSYGISKKDIIVDPLCLTITSNLNSAKITLQSVKMLNKLGIKTSLGVSNISYGLPCRDKINSNFFTLALQNGLNLAIINPFSTKMMDSYYSFNALSGFDNLCKNYINYASNNTESKDTTSKEEMTLSRAIDKGLKQQAISLVKDLLKEKKPLEIINEIIIPSLNSAGQNFEKKKIFLPELLAISETTSAVFDILKANFTKQEKSNKSIILLTVKGDIHDIGKNIVKALMESHGIIVYDLGKDVDSDKVVEAVEKTGSQIVGLSALMTTTVTSMEQTIKVLREKFPSIVIMVGGAVLTESYAKQIGASFYGKDAISAVKFVKEYYDNIS